MIRNRILVRYLVLFAAILQFGQKHLSAQDCAVTLQLSPRKVVYGSDELVSIVLELRNSGIGDEYLFLAYPALQGPKGVDVTFTATGSLRPKTVPASGLIAATRLPAGRRISAELYLQSTLEGFQAGRYNIPWRANVRCEGKTHTAQAQGVLQFEILPLASTSLNSDLSEAFRRVQADDEEVLRRIEAGAGYYTETPFRTAEAMEILRLTTSPLVVPYLQQLASEGDLGRRSQAFDALVKFETNSAAREFVRQMVRSDDPELAVLSLGVLNTWRENLPEQLLRELLANNSHVLQVGVLRYIARSRNRSYGALVKEYTNSSNPFVAKEARQAETQLVGVD